MFSILVAAVELSKNGDVVKVDYTPVFAIAPLVLVLVIFGLVFSFLFYKKRLEYKQIMAAIEKGTPLSELRPAKPAGPAWIKTLTTGIALLMVSIVFFLLTESVVESRKSFLSLPAGTVATPWLFFSGILLVIGVSLLIRGLLQRKAERRALALEKGIPLSELERSNWITSISVGIGFLIFSLPCLFSFLEPLIRRNYVSSNSLTGFGVLFAIGLAFFIHGLLLRKAQRQIKSPGQINAEDIKKTNLKSPNSKLKAQN